MPERLTAPDGVCWFCFNQEADMNMRDVPRRGLVTICTNHMARVRRVMGATGSVVWTVRLNIQELELEEADLDKRRHPRS